MVKSVYKTFCRRIQGNWVKTSTQAAADPKPKPFSLVERTALSDRKDGFE